MIRINMIISYDHYCCCYYVYLSISIVIILLYLLISLNHAVFHRYYVSECITYLYVIVYCVPFSPVNACKPPAQNLDFGVDCDSRVAIVGPNGAGGAK